MLHLGLGPFPEVTKILGTYDYLKSIPKTGSKDMENTLGALGAWKAFKFVFQGLGVTPKDQAEGKNTANCKST